MTVSSANFRKDGRRADEIRPVRIVPHFLRWAEGSVLIQMGETHVVCAVSVEEGVPPFLRETGSGWLTAEYGMLPRSTHTRSEREAARGRQKGRTQEIQRLIGRSLRSVTDLSKLGERTILVDCDVLQADGGTRTASITGAWVALALACERLRASGALEAIPLTGSVAAVSAGIVDGVECVDLAYEEDSRAEVDMNLVMNDRDELVEIQGTAEGRAFTRAQLDRLVELGSEAIRELGRLQQAAVADGAASR